MTEKKLSHGAGKLLISAPFLTDFFKRTVIYLTEHNEKGSVGFILNKPLNIKLNKTIDDFPEFDAPVILGGPVQTELVNFIHRCGNILEDSIFVDDNISWGGNFEQLKDLISNKTLNPEDFRFFLGYSGWGESQLDNEMKSNSWIVTEENTDFIFTVEFDNMWNRALKNLGGKYTILSTFPDDPTVN